MWQRIITPWGERTRRSGEQWLPKESGESTGNEPHLVLQYTVADSAKETIAVRMFLLLQVPVLLWPRGRSSSNEKCVRAIHQAAAVYARRCRRIRLEKATSTEDSTQ